MKLEDKTSDVRAIETQGELLSLLDQIGSLLEEVRDKVATHTLEGTKNA